MNQIDEPQIKNYVMISHLKRAKIYRSLEQKNKAILEYGELLSKFSSSSKNNKHYLTAKIQRAILLFEEDQENEALSEINEVIDHHKNKKSIMMKTFVAKALYQKAIFVGKKGDLELAMQLYFEVHLTYKDEINVNIIEVVIMSLIGKAIAFETKGENNEAIQVYNEIDKQYHLVPERIIQKLVIKSMINKGNLLLHLERWGLAHEHFGEVVNRFNGKDEFKQSIITANIGIAIALKGLMKYKDSFDILNSINRSDIENSELIEELLNQYCDIGYLLTIEKNYHSAKIAFLNAFMDGNIFAGNNLSYLIRRYPDESDNFPNHELLLAEGLKINEPFSLVNRALLFIDENTNESWINASKCFSKINELESVIEWWHKLAANENDPEGHLVIGMLLINNPHHDPDGFSVQQRFSYVAHNYSFPEWLIASY
ncbi:hypothetical protein [Paenibacillus sp. P22]|uniref:hypothetical protein n=1 Tax=Paenibacillus sp. P22 TaxID=483908 RepID=UPI0012EE2246|nr:hypothetical protein [Paenibacillus sp. P22]